MSRPEPNSHPVDWSQYGIEPSAPPPPCQHCDAFMAHAKESLTASHDPQHVYSVTMLTIEALVTMYRELCDPVSVKGLESLVRSEWERQVAVQLDALAENPEPG